MRSAAVCRDTNVRLMPADCEAPCNGLDESLLKMEVSSAHVARTVNQERDVSGNRDVRDTCWRHVTIIVSSSNGQ